MNLTMSVETASILAQIIAIFFLAMIVEGRTLLPTRLQPRRTHLKRTLLFAAGTMLTEIYLIVTVESGGASGNHAFGVWLLSIGYFAATVFMTVVYVFAAQDKAAKIAHQS